VKPPRNLFVALRDEPGSNAVALVEAASGSLSIAVFTTPGAIARWASASTPYAALPIDGVREMCDRGGFGLMIDPGSPDSRHVTAAEAGKFLTELHSSAS
jgi:hypothetical protein